MSLLLLTRPLETVYVEPPPSGDWLLDFSTPDDSGYLALYSVGV